MSCGPRSRFFHRFDVRTAAKFTGVLAVAVLLVSLSLHWGLRYNLYREADEFLEMKLRALLHHLSDPRWNEDLIRADLVYAATVGANDQLFFRLYDESGKELWTIPDGMTGRCVPPSADLRGALAGTRKHLDVAEKDGEYLTLIFPVPRQVAAKQACQAGMSESRIEARVAKYSYILGALGVVVVAIGAMVSHTLVRRPLRAIQAIAAQAREISATALHLRLPESPAGDEFADLSKTLNGMLERLEDSVRRLNQFTGDAAHELRGPVSRMRTAAEVALRSPRGESELREALADVVEQADKLGHLINDLLLIAQQDGAAATGRQEVLDCRYALEESFGLCEGMAEEKGVALRLATIETGRVQGHRQRLLQALVNLMENAVKFTDAGGSVDIEGRAVGRDYHFIVRDTGRGIAPENLPHVFDRFYRVDAARTPNVGGTGLGLSIVKAIATAHGGRVDVQSRVGHGSTFMLILPREPGG